MLIALMLHSPTEPTWVYFAYAWRTGRLDWHSVALEVGQDWSIFAPLNPASLAMVAEFNGSGNPWIRLPQIRVEAKKTLNPANRLLYQIAASY